MASLTLISGTKEDDVLAGTSGTDILLGGNGQDVLDGGAGNDLLSGGNGEDVLDGGAGNDLLLAGNGNDSLDGGSGSDLLLAGNGNDDANFTWSENTDSKDYYDGGRGFDTLQLTLTSAELELAKEDIAAFNAFLTGGGHVFEFQSFDLAVRDFEALVLNIVDSNVAPVASGNIYEAAEDVALTISGPGVLGNDIDPEDATLSAALVTGPTYGSVALNSDGSFTYTPGTDFYGEDSFTYKANDGALDSNVATVTLHVAAVNDAPVAMPDNATVDEDYDLTIDALANDSDIDANDAPSLISATLASGLGSATISGNQIVYSPGSDYQHLKAGESAHVAIDYTITDKQGATTSCVVNVLVTGVDEASAGKISVAVIGGDASTYIQAARQLDIAKFDAVAIGSGAYADEGAWDRELANYDVVVLGGSGVSPGTDYTQLSLFTALENFVDDGGGVVTTGWFAQTLSLMPDPAAQGHADYITPIARAGFNYVGLNAEITVSDSTQAIVSGLPEYPYLSNARYHELALAFDETAGAVELATAVAGGTPFTAIAYDEQVGLGRTAYVGGTYLANSAYGTEYAGGVREGVADQILEQAVTWAAGGRAAPAELQLADQFHFVDVAMAQDLNGSSEPLPGDDEPGFDFGNDSPPPVNTGTGDVLVASLEADYQPGLPASYVSADADALI